MELGPLLGFLQKKKYVYLVAFLTCHNSIANNYLWTRCQVTAWTMSGCGFFLVRNFQHSDWIRSKFRDIYRSSHWRCPRLAFLLKRDSNTCVLKNAPILMNTSGGCFFIYTGRTRENTDLKKFRIRILFTELVSKLVCGSTQPSTETTMLVNFNLFAYRL